MKNVSNKNKIIFGVLTAIAYTLIFWGTTIPLDITLENSGSELGYASLIVPVLHAATFYLLEKRLTGGSGCRYTAAYFISMVVLSFLLLLFGYPITNFVDSKYNEAAKEEWFQGLQYILYYLFFCAAAVLSPVERLIIGAVKKYGKGENVSQ